MKKKIDLLILFTIFTAIILFTLSITKETHQEKEILQNQLNTLEISITNEYKIRLKESVNHAMTFIDSTYQIRLEQQNKNNQTISNKLEKVYEEILIQDVKNYFYNKIFDKARYLWVNKIVNFEGGDNYAIRLIHPNLKKTEGLLLSTKIKDIKGNTPYKEELEGVSKNEEIFFTYFFKELNSKDITEKLSYSKLNKKLNWVVATGIPITILKNKISKQKAVLETIYHDHLKRLILIKFVIVLIFFTSLIIFRKKIHFLLDENLELTKKLESKFQTAQTNLNKFFDLPLNLLVILKKDGTILEINSGWNKILGYNENLLHTNIQDIIHPNDISKIKEEIEKLPEINKTDLLEIRLKTSDERYKTFIWSANSSKQENLIYATAQDITELKQKTNLIHQQSKMASLGEMTANIAHQWRQPLSIISTSSSGILLKKELGDLDDKFLEDTLNQITNSTKYLSDTIEDFRNFYSPHKEENLFSLKHIVNKMMKLIEKRYQHNNIIILTEIEDIETINYENELLQVLINITNNARDQLLKQPLKDKFIKIKAFKKDKHIFIEVLDNGRGIDEKIIKRVFEPYFTTKEKSVGTGIGLYMSEEIVTKHLKGDISVTNESFEYENKKYTGAKFIIKLKL